MDLLYLQETRWKGEKSKDLARGHKLVYNGDTGRNGVAIMLSKSIREAIVQVSRKSERVMSVKLSQGDSNLTVISAYAPQVGCEGDEKDQVWEELDQEVNSVPLNEKVIVGGGLNGHVGQEREGVRDGMEGRVLVRGTQKSRGYWIL